MSYSNIHAHTCYSIRDSILKIKDYVSRVKELGMESCGVSEHGNLVSNFKFYKECKAQNIKPILGQEFYYTENAEDKGSNYHLMVIAKNNEGYKNLCKLSSYAFINGFYRKPRISREILHQYKEGLIVSASCMSGRSQRLLLENNIDGCNEEIDAMKAMFGEDYYLEVHSHNIPEEVIITNHFRNYGREKGIKVIAANDTHYLKAEDKIIHNVFKQLAYGTVGISDDDGFPGSGYHVLSPEEMKEKFLIEELDNTLEIASKCNVSFKFKGYNLPKFETENNDSFLTLKNMCLKALKEKGLDKDDRYIARLSFELEQIHLMDLEDYFLVVADYLGFCKRSGIPLGYGRGSAAGALTAYLAGITRVDPLKYDLIFGRMLNPGRALTYNFGI